ncbi:GAF domain-containing SpoIIE family protein phosphatase [Candidatus Viridilinea mediisalina]|uniref:Stage II sporulation protein E n=1 Tax=Candidatus Viridilinea mediisalina TaxID=2024553 RepID=A0A2A6RDI6_9CHLR|nr:GAF domain-containing SpoIIE family protein phosphatase [Candidatus Viridilinea mediisalina]PDV99073.1 stage II sporulation protein E [Candidatus Viridilinea mediisalina]
MPSNDSQQRLQALAALNELAQVLNAALNLREVLDRALEHALGLLNFSTGWIFLHDEQTGYSLAVRHNVPPALPYPGPAWQGDCDCQELCRSGRLDKTVHLVTCSRLRGALGDKWGLARHVSVLLRSNDELLGILNLAMAQWGRIGPFEQHVLATAGNIVGAAIVRARLYEQAKIRRVQEQRALLNLSQDLLLSEALEPALQRLARVGARLLEADACAFIEADELAGRAVLRAAHGWQLPHDAPWPVSLDATSPHLWYLPERANELAAESLSPLPTLLAAQGFMGHLGLAVELGGVPVGTLMVNTHATRHFFEEEGQLLALLGNLLIQTLERERLSQEALAREKLEQELDLAREIQASFLPDCCPHVPGYQIWAYYRAARQVGGDFFDFIELPSAPGQAAPSAANRASSLVVRGSKRFVQQSALRDCYNAQRLGIVIADVTDKGVPAALFMALSRTLLRATAIDGRRPDEVLQRANRLILADSRAGLFVTCFYAILETATGEVSFANGGHNYPLLWEAATGEVRQLRAQGIVLGIVPDPRFEVQYCTLQPGDVLLFYTDGVTEAMNLERDLFGDERLTAVLEANHQRSPQEIVHAVLAAVASFVGGQSQSDDITMVVLKREVGER